MDTRDGGEVIEKVSVSRIISNRMMTMKTHGGRWPVANKKRLEFNNDEVGRQLGVGQDDDGAGVDDDDDGDDNYLQ